MHRDAVERRFEPGGSRRRVHGIHPSGVIRNRSSLGKGLLVERHRERDAKIALRPILDADECFCAVFEGWKYVCRARGFTGTVVDREFIHMTLIKCDDEVGPVHLVGDAADKLDIAVDLVVVGRSPVEERFRRGVVELEGRAGQLEQCRAVERAACDSEEVVGNVNLVGRIGVLDGVFDRVFTARHGGQHKHVTAFSADGEGAAGPADEGIAAVAAIDFDIVAKRTRAGECRCLPRVDHIVSPAAFNAERFGSRIDSVVRRRTFEPLGRLDPVSRIESAVGLGLDDGRVVLDDDDEGRIAVGHADLVAAASAIALQVELKRAFQQVDSRPHPHRIALRIPRHLFDGIHLVGAALEIRNEGRRLVFDGMAAGNDVDVADAGVVEGVEAVVGVDDAGLSAVNDVFAFRPFDPVIAGAAIEFFHPQQVQDPMQGVVARAAEDVCEDAVRAKVIVLRGAKQSCNAGRVADVEGQHIVDV